MNFQVFHVNPGKKLKKNDVNNNLSHFMSVFPTDDDGKSVHDILCTTNFVHMNYLP